MELIHILPRKNLSRDLVQNYELYLTDEVLKHPADYCLCTRGTPSYKILDNSLNELGVSVKLAEMDRAAGVIWPDEFVIPDDVDPAKSRALMERTLESIESYPHLRELRKMAVVHANSFNEYISELLRLGRDPRVDVVGIPKTVARAMSTDKDSLNGRVVLLACAKGLGFGKTVHFLGWAGFREFEYYENFVSSNVRSMDSRLMLESKDLWLREDLLSHVDLENGKIVDVVSKIRRVRRGAYTYGLR